jgi:hypothetical protein
VTSYGATAYEAIVAPIFRARCIECHGEEKQKVKLALHTWEALTRGSDAGPVLMGGKPAESPLLARLRLPLSDEEHMPPEDRPQPSPEEIALLDRWIERGATQSLTLAELQLSEPLAKTAAGLPAKLAANERAHVPAEPPWEFDPVEVDQKRAPLAGKVVALQRRFPGALSYESRTSAALHFTAVGFGRDFGDAELAELAALVTELVALDLSGTAITEASAAVLARFSRLRALRARYTELGDKTVEALAALPALELLVMTGTKVTPASVAAFTRMRALRSLRVAETGAQRASQAANLPVVPSAEDLFPPAEIQTPER